MIRMAKSFTVAVASVALLAGTLGGASSALAAPENEPSPTGACDAGWYFSSTSRSADTFAPVGGVLTGYNGSTVNSTVSFTSTTSGTVTTTTTGTIGTTVTAAVASISATYGISAAVAKTVTTGVTIAITVPAKRYGNGQYGAFKANVAGRSDYRTPTCAITNTVRSTVSTPWRTGWNTWIS